HLNRTEDRTTTRRECHVKRSNLITRIALCGALLVPGLALAGQAPPPAPGTTPSATARPPGAPGATQRPMVSCHRGGLPHAVRLYLEAQAKGDISNLPLATGLGYWENMQPADVKTGYLTKKLVIDKSLSIYDDQSCQTFTEIWVTDKAEPWVSGIRMRVNHDK